MLSFLAILHVCIALFLIMFVLLQDSKGGAMGILGGGSSNSVFGSTGAASFLVKVTRWTAIAFAATCITLTYLTSTQKGQSLMDDFIPEASKQEEPISTTPTKATAPSKKQDKTK